MLKRHVTSNLAIMIGVGCLIAVQAPAADGLVSVKAAGPIAIDGTLDAAWEKAAPLNLTLDKTPYKPDVYAGISQTEVSIRSLYDAENVYFAIQYKDPTRSLARRPWVKQADGSWKQEKKPDSTGHENTFYEDRLSIIWDINARGFSRLGCAMVCHIAVNGKIDEVADSSVGRKYTNQPGTTVDLWVWRAIQSGAVGQADDQYINDNKPPDAKSWGRRGDGDASAGYVDNINEAKNGPAFVSAKPDASQPWIKDEEKVPFVDSFKPGDSVPSVIVKPVTGPRADLSSAGKWTDGTWTIEIKRKLVTTGENANGSDVQFKDLSKAYPFGLAVFDNAHINHLYHGGAPKLTFKP